MPDITALILLSFVLIAGLIYLMILQYNKVKQNDKINEWIRYQSADVIKSATDKADSILSAAEVDALRLIVEKKTETALFEKEFQLKLEQTIQTLLNNLQTNVGKIEQDISANLDITKKQHDQFLVQLEKQSVNWQSQNQDEMKSKVNSLLFDFEQQLTEFFSKAEQKSLDAINLEIKSARQLIDSYKAQQLSIIDENIVAVLERTLNLVLKEKLTLKDQLDLVYEALEKAKIEKFLV